DLLFERLSVRSGRFEHHIPARDKGLDAGKPKCLDQRAQVVHLDGMAANIDRTQERDIAVHRRPVIYKVVSVMVNQIPTEGIISDDTRLAVPPIACICLPQLPETARGLSLACQILHSEPV